MSPLFSRPIKCWCSLVGWLSTLAQSRLLLARQALLSALEAGDEPKVRRLITRCCGLNWIVRSNQTSWLSFSPLQKLLLSDLEFPCKLRLLHLLLESGADPLMVCPSWAVKQIPATQRWAVQPDPAGGPNWRKIMSDEPDWRLAMSFALRRDPALEQNALIDLKGGSFIPKPLFFTNNSLALLEAMQKCCSQNLFQLRLDSYGCTLLHYAVLGDNPQVVKLLLQQGADLTVANDFLETPYDIAKSSAVLATIRAWELSQVIPKSSHSLVSSLGYSGPVFSSNRPVRL